mmetsp:Transcript_38911/g.44326  ORF Transcript_38911/g.44326 Transcript_38911/m.44326 type:complete len:217 (-) Transcript_38911:487-1137(-)
MHAIRRVKRAQEVTRMCVKLARVHIPSGTWKPLVIPPALVTPLRRVITIASLGITLWLPKNVISVQQSVRRARLQPAQIACLAIQARLIISTSTLKVIRPVNVKIKLLITMAVRASTSLLVTRSALSVILLALLVLKLLVHIVYRANLPFHIYTKRLQLPKLESASILLEQTMDVLWDIIGPLEIFAQSVIPLVKHAQVPPILNARLAFQERRTGT